MVKTAAANCLLEDAMKAIALARIDPVLAGRVLAASVVLVALGSSQAILRFTRLLLEATWLYLSNTRG